MHNQPVTITCVRGLSFKKLARDRDVIRMTVNAEVTEGRRHRPIKHNHVFDGH